MLFHRRQFLANIATASFLAGSGLIPQFAHAESLALNWPSNKYQAPSERNKEHSPVITAVAVHPEGNFVAVAGDDHVVYLWDLREEKIVQKLTAHTDWVHTLAFSPSGKTLASAGTDRQVIFWDIATAEKLYVFMSHEFPVTKVAWSHNGEVMAGIGFEDKLRVYDVKTRQLVRELKCSCRDMRAVEYSHDDSLLAVGGRDGVVRIWNAADGVQLTDYAVHSHRIRGLAFSPDRELIVTSGEDRKIHVHRIAAKDEGFYLPRCPAKVMSLEFYGPNLLATGCSDNVIRLWDITARAEIGKLKGHTGSVSALARHRNLLVSGSYDTTFRVWTITENIAGDGNRSKETLRTSRKPE